MMGPERPIELPSVVGRNPWEMVPEIFVGLEVLYPRA